MAGVKSYKINLFPPIRIPDKPPVATENEPIVNASVGFKINVFFYHVFVDFGIRREIDLAVLGTQRISVTSTEIGQQGTE